MNPQPPPLPIDDIRADVADALSSGSRVILQAPTGSGKSTRVPGMILDDLDLPPEKQIVVLQPRRLAARMLARRVARERNVPLGDEVGYQVRLDRKAGPRTRIRYVTEGILMREWLRAPRLDHVACIVFDEFHERHLHGDLSLAHALRLQARARPDLNLVLMSATLDTDPLRAFLPDASVITSEGRTYPVHIHYLHRDPRATRTPVWESAATAANRLAEDREGDLLVFMPGRFEIDRTLEALKRTPLGKSADLLPLHGELSNDQQDRAATPGGRRRVIVSTNIAETSLTLEGVTGVVDSGLARIARFDPVRGVDQLNVEPISRASADQRAGRAGRTAPGTCVRLWTEAGHRNRPARDTPEIHRVDLAEAVLTLAALGVTDWSELALPDPPEPRVLANTRDTLRRLGALAADGAPTSTGKRLLDFPAHPRMGRLLLEAETRGVVPEAARIAALLQGRPLFVRKVSDAVQRERRDLFAGDGHSDVLMALRALEWAEAMRFDTGKCRELGVHAGAARQAAQTAGLFARAAKSRPSPAPPHTRDLELRKCLAVAFADHLARRRPDTRRCDLVDGRVAEIDRDSVCDAATLLVATEIRDSERAKTPFLVGCTRVEDEWLGALWPDLFDDSTEARYDAHLKRVVTEHRKTFGELVLHTDVSHDVTDDDAARILLERVEAGDIPLPGWDEEVERWITRLNCLAAWRPDWELPPITAEDRRMVLSHMLAGCRTRKDVKKLDISSRVAEWLDPMGRDLVRDHCPTRVALASGRRGRIRYEEGAPPTVSSKLQDFFGMTQTPAVAGGTIHCVAELLAPNGRPAARTDDLARFWKEGYPLVRKDLKGRYPKHPWPESV